MRRDIIRRTPHHELAQVIHQTETVIGVGIPRLSILSSFKILTAFIRRRGRILTREQLLDDVWRPDSSSTDRVIDNHIMNLRRKLEPEAGEPRMLVSVRVWDAALTDEEQT